MTVFYSHVLTVFSLQLGPGTRAGPPEGFWRPCCLREHLGHPNVGAFRADLVSVSNGGSDAPVGSDAVAALVKDTLEEASDVAAAAARSAESLPSDWWRRLAVPAGLTG